MRIPTKTKHLPILFSRQVKTYYFSINGFSFSSANPGYYLGNSSMSRQQSRARRGFVCF